MIASRESASLAEKLIADTCAKQGIAQDQLRYGRQRVARPHEVRVRFGVDRWPPR